jgi:hypothetical protein
MQPRPRIAQVVQYKRGRRRRSLIFFCLASLDTAAAAHFCPRVSEDPPSWSLTCTHRFLQVVTVKPRYNDIHCPRFINDISRYRYIKG